MWDLDHFLAAQDSGGIFEQAIRELRAERKRSHWMWFVFPQMAGLGQSSMAHRYALSGLAEAAAYLSHPVLGSRLRLCVGVLLEISDLSAEQIFGSVDAVKLRSSMTLFAAVDRKGSPFQEVLGRFFGGEADALTLELLGRSAAP